MKKFIAIVMTLIMLGGCSSCATLQNFDAWAREPISNITTIEEQIDIKARLKAVEILFNKYLNYTDCISNHYGKRTIKVYAEVFDGNYDAAGDVFFKLVSKVIAKNKNNSFTWIMVPQFDPVDNIFILMVDIDSINHSRRA